MDCDCRSGNAVLWAQKGGRITTTTLWIRHWFEEEQVFGYDFLCSDPKLQCASSGETNSLSMHFNRIFSVKNVPTMLLNLNYRAPLFRKAKSPWILWKLVPYVQEPLLNSFDLAKSLTKKPSPSSRGTRRMIALKRAVLCTLVVSLKSNQSTTWYTRHVKFLIVKQAALNAPTYFSCDWLAFNGRHCPFC